MSKVTKGLCVAACALLLASTVQADRRQSLSRNLLIDDQDDMFIFPHQVTRYRNLIGFDYDTAANGGNAILTLGDEGSAYGIAFHRGDAILQQGADPLFGPSQSAMRADIASLFTGIGPGIDEAPAAMLDLLYGRATSDSEWGLRLSLGRAADATTDAMDNTTGAEDLFVAGEFGYGSGVRGQETRMDISISAMFDLANEVGGGTDEASAFGFGVGGLLRMYMPTDNPNIEIGVLGNVTLRNASVTDSDAPMEPSASILNLGLGGGVGPVVSINGATIAAHGTLRVGFSSADPNSEVDDDSTSTFGVVIPGLLASVEVPVTDWFFVRSGAQYDYAITSTSLGDTSGTDWDSSFSWTAGIGVLVDDFRFDGTVTDGFVTGGPNFIGGGSGFLAMASLTYVWDSDRDGLNRPKAGAPGPVVEPAPAPVVAPAPAPAPAPTPAPPPALQPVPVEPEPVQQDAVAPPPPGPAATPPPAATGEVSGSVGGSLSTP